MSFEILKPDNRQGRFLTVTLLATQVRVTFGGYIVNELGLTPGMKVRGLVGRDEDAGKFRLLICPDGERTIWKPSGRGKLLMTQFARWPEIQADKARAEAVHWRRIEGDDLAVEIALPKWGRPMSLRVRAA